LEPQGIDQRRGQAAHATVLKQGDRIPSGQKKGGKMNADMFKGKWGQFKGELKRQWGKFTDDDLTQIEGNYDKFLGKVQERYGTQKDDISGWAD
jgi:uncharacterized protein YjbJ (UPF0337 family)